MGPTRMLRGLGALSVGLGALSVSGLAATGASQPAPPDAAARRVIQAARQQLGDAYKWAGNGPDEWDCSGLTSVMWRTTGQVREIPRTSRDQQRWALPVPAEQALPGDLVFFEEPVSHVGIYLGNNRMIDASSSRGKVTERPLWSAAVIRFGRVPRPTAPPVRNARPASSPSPTATATPPPQQSKATAARASNAPVPPRGHKPRTRARSIAMRFVRGARSVKGARYVRGGDGPAFDSAGLVRWAWLKAGGEDVGTTPGSIAHVARTVPLRDLTAGDLIIYGDRATHVGIYVGGGQMIDASPGAGRVVQRDVFSAPVVRFARLP